MKGIYSCKKCGGHYWQDGTDGDNRPLALCAKCGNTQYPEVA